jgi:protein phosphatase
MVGAIPIELLDALRGTTRKADGTPVDDDSVDIEVEEGLADPYSDVPSGAYALILVTGIARSDIGLKRKRNEDLFLVLPEEPLFAVADGMGGYAAGELAAQLAVDTITTAFRSKAFDGTPNKDIPKRGDELVRSIQMANAMVFERAQEDPELKGMGTTLVAARFSPTKRRVYVAHVGDSRAYRVREGKIVQLTIDHTLGELMNVADKTAHYLARAVGVTAAVEVDLMIDEPKAEDYYLLCSDGLTKMVDDETILDIVQREGEIEPKLRRLVETANERGGKDNITVILIHVREPFESARPKPAPS